MKDRMGNTLSTAKACQKGVNRLKNICADFELWLLRLAGHIPSHTIRLLCYRSAGIKIGQGSRVHMWANFFQPENITLGTDTIVGDHVFLDGRAKLTIGSHVDIASSVMIYNSQHEIDSDDFHATYEPVVIEDYVFIGPRVIILPGVTIGRGAVGAAGAVVTKNISPFAVVAGIPAQAIGERKNKNPHYNLGRPRLFQ
ncbi:acyltransferase [Candidatus Microgenomates bacterium]|nr:acyltransferase [Candidatus Microgenomates bacterium]